MKIICPLCGKDMKFFKDHDGSWYYCSCGYTIMNEEEL